MTEPANPTPSIRVNSYTHRDFASVITVSHESGGGGVVSLTVSGSEIGDHFSVLLCAADALHLGVALSDLAYKAQTDAGAEK